jgi:N-methylhydantoinase A
VIVGGQLIDLSGVNSIDQAMAVTRSELAGLTTETSIALIGIPPSRGL